MSGLLPLPPDHDDRMMRAYAVAQWHLGDATWADTIIRAYIDPDDSDAAEALAELEDAT